MNPEIVEKLGKATIVALGTAVAKYGPKVVKKLLESIGKKK